MNLKKLLIILSKKRDILESDIFDFKDIKSILLRPLGNAIGDATVHTAHLYQLKEVFPNAKLGVIVSKQNRVIFEHSNLVDEYVERNILAYFSHHNKWDLLLDFENNFNSASLFMDRILMPKYIAIFRKYEKKYYNFSTIYNYNFHFPQIDNEPLSNYLMKSSFNKENSLVKPYSKLYTSSVSDKKIASFWQNGKIRLLLCPQGSKRQIPPRELGELLCESLSDNLLKKIDIICSYTKTASAYLEEMATFYPELNIRLSPNTSLEDYLSLISSADFVIAVDGGSLHISCAFQKPLLSFFANSQPNLGTWEPLVYPNIPHLKVLTKENVGSNSNLTENFELNKAKIWLKEQLDLLIQEKSKI